MTTDTTGAGSGSVISFPANPGYQEFLVKRDKEGPLSFAGVRMAHARENALLLAAGFIEGAVYRTRGGKFITSLSKTSIIDPDSALGRPGGYNKAAVHDTFEEAMAWFRPGRVTESIRQQLGLDKPVRIE
jgi:hypothetical protein